MLYMYQAPITAKVWREPGLVGPTAQVVGRVCATGLYRNNA